MYLISRSHPETHGQERTAFHTISQHSISSLNPFVQKKMLTSLQRDTGTPDLNPGPPQAGIQTGETRVTGPGDSALGVMWHHVPHSGTAAAQPESWGRARSPAPTERKRTVAGEEAGVMAAPTLHPRPRWMSIPQRRDVLQASWKVREPFLAARSSGLQYSGLSAQQPPFLV